MDTTHHFPPSARDFQVYQRVTLEATTTRQAAADFSISQTRVRQILQRVSRWLAETLPPRTDTTDASHLHLAQHLAADRLQYIYGQAMHGWRLTKESKYAGVVLRCIAAQGKLPVIPGTLDALVADALEGPLPEEGGEGEAPAKPAVKAKDAANANQKSQIQNPKSSAPQSEIRTPNSSPPPPRDCSTSTSQPQLRAASPISEPSITSAAATASENTSDARSTARRAFFAPAQSSGGTGILPVSMAASDECTRQITELKITPRQLGLSLRKKLSRRERRKLRRTAQKVNP